MNSPQLQFVKSMKKEKVTIEQSPSGCCIVGTNQLFTGNMYVKQELAEYGIFPQKPTNKLVVNDMPVNIKTSSQNRSCCQMMCLNNWSICSLLTVENEYVFSSSTPRTDIIHLADFVLRMLKYSYSTATINKKERRGTGILNEFKK